MVDKMHCPNCGYDLRDPEFGKKVRAARLKAGITQAEVADAIVVTHGYVSLIENGTKPTPDVNLQEAWWETLRELAAAKTSETTTKKG